MSAILLIAVPLLTAFISILFKKLSPYFLVAASLFAVVGIYFVDLGAITIGGYEAPYGIGLFVDQVTIVGLYAVNGLFLLTVLVTVRDYQKMSSILLVALAGLNGLLLTADLFNLFVFIEITAIAAYLISSTNKKPLQTFNYLVAGTVGSSLYLLGLILLYNMAGTLNMAEVSAFVFTQGLDGAASLPLLLMFIGLGVEAKLLPFNSWVKGILGTSNNLSGTMLASVYATAIAIMFGRLLASVIFVHEQISVIIMVVLAVTILAGEAMAYSSTKAREVLLFSSIAQAGIVVLLFANYLVPFALLYAISSGFSKFILFGVVTRLTEEKGTDEIEELKGSFTNNKIVGVSFTVAALNLLGLPLFAGFFIKISSLLGVFLINAFSPEMLLLPGGKFFFVTIILISSVIEGVYFVKMLGKLWYNEETTRVRFGVVFPVIISLLAVTLVVFGVYEDALNEVLEYIGGAFL